MSGQERRVLAARETSCASSQPKVDLYTSRVIGVEALLRWDHPVLAPPDGQGLGLAVVAEAVETEAQAELLRRLLLLPAYAEISFGD